MSALTCELDRDLLDRITAFVSVRAGARVMWSRLTPDITDRFRGELPAEMTAQDWECVKRYVRRARAARTRARPVERRRVWRAEDLDEFADWVVLWADDRIDWGQVQRDARERFRSLITDDLTPADWMYLKRYVRRYRADGRAL